MVGILIETVGRLAGVSTRRVRSHGSFFEAISDAGPTHVVIDLTMPGMTGEDVLRQLAEVQCTARVIVCSGADPARLAAAADLAISLGLDFAGILPKPFAPAALRELLAAG